MIAKRVATIGVYGFTLERFLARLREADVRVLLDVRQRRGVRGSQYAWANSRRLQDALAKAGIEYRHLAELAPTTELREAQYRADARRGEGKRSRTVLAPEYAEGYRQEILSRVDLARLLGELPDEGTAALMCVERDAVACHRSLVAAELELLGADVSHLVP